MAFGLTPQGFVPMQEQDVITDLETAFQGGFGKNVNLSSSSIFGQIIGTFSERFTLLWQLGETIYDSQYPGGAEGTSVDNILALNNLKRLKASPTVTQSIPDVLITGVTLYGLLLFGTPGTFIQAGSVIQNTASPPLSFTLDTGVTIGNAANAVQTLFFGNVPDTGAFSVSIVDPAGQTLTTGTLAFGALASASQVVWAVAATSGQYKLTLNKAGTPLATGFIQWNDSAATIQIAVRLLTGYSAATVTAVSGGYKIDFGANPAPLVTVTNSTLDHSPTVTDSVQAKLNNLHDTTAANYPFTDVSVTGNFSGGFVCTFGSNTPAGSNPNSANQPIALMTQATNTLQQGSTVTNLNITSTTTGTQAKAVGTATCSVDGPNFVAAGTLTVIGSPVSGWTGVTNQLDCVTGRNVEDDTQALQRRSQRLAANANGPLQAIVEKVEQVAGVTQAKGFSNLNSAALQFLAFTTPPTTGSYKLNINNLTTGSIAYNAAASAIQTAIRALSGYSVVLVTGDTVDGFTIDFNGAQGGQAQQLFTVSNDTTDGAPTVVFGRPGHSFEIVVQGGSEADIASAIYGSMPAGIKSYGSTTVQINDDFGTPISISFSRPVPVTIYVSISLTTDTYKTPGSPGSGSNPNAEFVPGSVSTIQSDILAIGNAVAIGGLIIGFGSDGLIGAFNDVPGIISYTLAFDKTASPSGNANIQLLAEQVAFFESFNVTVSWT